MTPIKRLDGLLDFISCPGSTFPEDRDWSSRPGCLRCRRHGPSEDLTRLAAHACQKDIPGVLIRWLA